MKKTLIILAGGLLVLLAGYFYFFNKEKSDQPQEQIVLEQTLTISQKYSSLRYRTENVLEKAEEYQDYDKWNEEMSSIIDGWKTLEGNSMELEKEADKMANKTAALDLVKNAHAYDSVEIQKVIESAPMGKQVRTLAKHLGVDAKMAQLILNQTQDQITREAYGEEGDVFETCEQNSMRIKNGAKVTVFVGGVVLTGGMSAVATSGALAKTALVVSGADLVLEVADDEAKIALGDKNKVSEMVGTLRIVTEPAAGILTIANLPGNVSKAMEKVSAAYFGADQVRSAIQDEKILGISIKTDGKGEVKARVSGLTEDELPQWRNENNIAVSTQTIEEILEIKEVKEVEEAKEVNNDLTGKTDNEKGDTSAEGSGWKGTLVSVSGGNEEKQITDLDFVVNKDGTVSGDNFKKWKQEGNSIKLFGEDEKFGYYEFSVSENSLTLSRMVIGDEEIMPGQEYMGGIAPSGILYKKN